MQPIADLLRERFPGGVLAEQATADGIPTLWVDRAYQPEMLRWLKEDAPGRFPLLADLSAVDESARHTRPGPAGAGTTLVSHLVSPQRGSDLRLKAALDAEAPRAPSATGVYPNADWYEREAFDLFGIDFEGHPNLRRILMPETWEGRPLLKSHYARATEAGPFRLPQDRFEAEEAALEAEPARARLPGAADDADLMVLSVGPNHPAVHGVFRVMLALDGEEIVACAPEVGFHHRGVEKMAERQTWHGFIPYTDRVDYLGGALNEMPYVLAVERLCGIEAPPRAAMARIMLCELFRIMSHLLFYGTMAQDVGALSPVFYMFRDRERAYRLVEGITGARMHPGWFRIGGLAEDLPEGWDRELRDFLDWLPGRLDDYERMVMRNRLFRARTVGVGEYDTAEALDWGVTGPGLRATGMEFDLRRDRPYGGYEALEFDVPTGRRGDSYDRTRVRIEEMRQSLRILRQCLEEMPGGPVKADHPLTTPPPRERMLHDIETLIHHFMHVSWGPVVPAGEATIPTESARGLTQYALTSDGDTVSYRTRIRTPSFAHLQMLPRLAEGLTVADLVAILGSVDFVMSDVDR